MNVARKDNVPEKQLERSGGTVTPRRTATPHPRFRCNPSCQEGESCRAVKGYARSSLVNKTTHDEHKNTCTMILLDCTGVLSSRKLAREYRRLPPHRRLSLGTAHHIRLSTTLGIERTCLQSQYNACYLVIPLIPFVEFFDSGHGHRLCASSGDSRHTGNPMT